MNENFDGKVFVTTSTKAQAVKNLLEYWTMKTELLRKRQDPTCFGNKDVQQRTRDYLVKNTKLSEQSFFKHLSTEDQEKVTKCFTMKEVPQPKKEMLNKSRQKAVVYVCLSGNASVLNMSSQAEIKYSVGDVFGSIELFHKVIVDGENMVGRPDEQGAAEELIDFGAGTFVRMDLNDVYNTVIKPHPDKLEEMEEKKNQETAVQISGIAWEKMTDDDKFYVRVYKRTKELVNKRFFNFLDSYRMVPKNSHMASYRYYHEGNKGREIYLDRRDQTWVFIFIDGSVRVELCASKSSNTDHTITYLRKSEENKMLIKKKTMPLMVLSAGSVVCIHPECFAQADDELPDEDDYASIVSRHQESDATLIPPLQQQQQQHEKKAKTNSKFRSRFPPRRAATSSSSSATGTGAGLLNRTGTAGSGSGGTAGAGTRGAGGESRRPSDWSVGSSHTVQTSATFHTVGSAIDSTMHRKTDVFVPFSNPPVGSDALYHIKLSFLATSSYLAIPYANFSRILDDSKLILPKIAKEIKWYLHSPNDQMKDRIARLIPWVRGNLDFNQREKSQRNIDTLDFVPSEVGPRNEDLMAPLGSFAATAVNPVALQSSQYSNAESEVTDFKPSTPKLAPPAPTSRKEALPNYSFKNVSRKRSEQDDTLNSMLLELRKSRDLSSKSNKSNKSGGSRSSFAKQLPLRASMFMTQDTEAKDFSIVEEDPNADDSDSDVDINDFRPKKTLSVAGGMASMFSDSTHSLKEDCAATLPSLDVSLESSVNVPLRKVQGISVDNTSTPSVLEIISGVGEDVDLQSLTTGPQ